MQRLLVTGASGQIGSDLIDELRRRHGAEAVIGADLAPPASPEIDGPHEHLDVRDRKALEATLEEHQVKTIYHLASLLSASGEKVPDRAWEVNIEGLKNVLDLARERDLRVFWPSSIAVFGPATPKEQAPQETVLDPSTMYGVTKVSGELLCRYYHRKHGVDVRSLRYPGLISYKTPPGGGTTDYAVEMFYAAAESRSYTCFVGPETRLPMMYMPDAIEAALTLMAADPDRISVRTSYNIASMSFSAEELARALEARVPDFSCRFAPDERQEIADSWPRSVDDTPAREDWGWQPAYDLERMTDEMLEKLREKHSLEV